MVHMHSEHGHRTCDADVLEHEHTPQSNPDSQSEYREHQG